MKKTIFMMAAAAVIAFASCAGNKTQADTEAVDTVVSETVEEVEALAQAVEAGDAAQTQTALEAIKARIEELLASGDEETAQKYKFQLEKLYNEHKANIDAVATEGLTIDQIINAAQATPETAQSVASDVKEAAKADAQVVREEVKQAAKQEAQKQVNAAAEKANAAVQEATQKAANKLLGK